MSISKIFIPNFVCVITKKKIENILNRILILLPRSCPGVGLRGAGGVKNFSVGICDGAHRLRTLVLGLFLSVLYELVIWSHCVTEKVWILMS